MGLWKLGYVNGLEDVVDEDAGIALYAPWSIDVLTLSTNTDINRSGGQITNISGGTITTSATFTTDRYNNGFCKIRSGDAAGIVYKVTDTTTNTVTLVDEDGAAADLDGDGALVDDYFEVVTAAPTFTFAENRNPLREDIKEVSKGVYKRYGYYDGGVANAQGKQPDDFVFFATVTDADSYKELQILANLKIDMGGFDGNYTSDELAPLILETGTHDADHQYLVHCMDVKKIRDGKKGSGLIDVTIHCQQIGIPSYRGV